MRHCWCVLLLAILLVGCGGSVTATLPYAGARVHGFPAPGNPRIEGDDKNGIDLFIPRAPDEEERIIALYADAWRADGYTVAQRAHSGGTTFLTFRRGPDFITVLFSAETRLGVTGEAIAIMPP